MYALRNVRYTYLPVGVNGGTGVLLEKRQRQVPLSLVEGISISVEHNWTWEVVNRLSLDILRQASGKQARQWHKPPVVVLGAYWCDSSPLAAPDDVKHSPLMTSRSSAR